MEANCSGGVRCATGYQVESVVGISLSTLFFCLFTLQVLSERWAPKKVVPVKVFFHRVGLLVALLLGALMVDPHGLHGVYGRQPGPLLSANVSCLLFGCAAAFLYYAINAIIGLRMEQRPTWLRHFLLAAALANGLVVNVFYTLMVAQDREKWRGYAYVWLAAVMLAVFVTVSACVHQLRTAIVVMLAANRETFVSTRVPGSNRYTHRYRRAPTGSASGRRSDASDSGADSDGDTESDGAGSTASRSLRQVSASSAGRGRAGRKGAGKERATDARMSSAASKLLAFQVVGTFICVLTVSTLVYKAQQKLREPDARQDRVDPTSYDPIRESFLWGQFLALGLFTWWAWIPLFVITRPPPESAAVPSTASRQRSRYRSRRSAGTRTSSGASAAGSVSAARAASSTAPARSTSVAVTIGGSSGPGLDEPLMAGAGDDAGDGAGLPAPAVTSLNSPDRAVAVVDSRSGYEPPAGLPEEGVEFQY